MRSFTVAAALAAVASVQAVNNDTTSDCPQQGGVHMIVARASLEPMGYGIIGAVKDAIIDRLPGSNAEFVVYEATLDQYTISESDGVVAARELINAYVTKCPGLPLVVLGYSQGAQVAMDSLVGQQDKNFPVNGTIENPLSDSILARTAALIVMGDPSFITTETFHVGNATKNSFFPRQNVPNFDSTDLGDRTQSYCDEGDPYCASGSFSQIKIHLGYVTKYGSQATDYVVNAVNAWYSANGGSASTGTASAGVTSRAVSSYAPTGTASRSVASASASLTSAKVSTSASATATATNVVSTGAASALQVAGAGAGAVVAGVLAFVL